MPPKPPVSPKTLALADRSTFSSRPSAQGKKPAGYLKDVNLPADKPKAISAPKKMSR